MQEFGTEKRQDVYPALLLRVSEVAGLLSIGRSKAYELIAAGEIPGVVRIGSTIRIHAGVLREWVDRLAQGSQGTLLR